MNANELRIGNLVFDDQNVIAKIESIQSKEYSEWNGDDIDVIFSIDGNMKESTISPIPLTEEWLLKAGFKSDDYKPGYIGIDVHNENRMSTYFVLSYPGRMGEWQKYFAWEFNNYMFNKIEFVHELQNFYAAMTGYELSFSTEP